MSKEKVVDEFAEGSNAVADQGFYKEARNKAKGHMDNMFYGHYLPKHFKKTNIISTNGR